MTLPFWKLLKRISLVSYKIHKINSKLKKKYGRNCPVTFLITKFEILIISIIY